MGATAAASGRRRRPNSVAPGAGGARWGLATDNEPETASRRGIDDHVPATGAHLEQDEVARGPRVPVRRRCWSLDFWGPSTRSLIARRVAPSAASFSELLPAPRLDRPDQGAPARRAGLILFGRAGIGVRRRRAESCARSLLELGNPGARHLLRHARRLVSGARRAASSRRRSASFGPASQLSVRRAGAGCWPGRRTSSSCWMSQPRPRSTRAPARFHRAGVVDRVAGGRRSRTRPRDLYGIQYHPEGRPHALREPRAALVSWRTSAAAT